MSLLLLGVAHTALKRSLCSRKHYSGMQSHKPSEFRLLCFLLRATETVLDDTVLLISFSLGIFKNLSVSGRSFSQQ